MVVGVDQSGHDQRGGGVDLDHVTVEFGQIRTRSRIPHRRALDDECAVADQAGRVLV
jgi:hypothetical protein